MQYRFVVLAMAGVFAACGEVPTAPEAITPDAAPTFSMHTTSGEILVDDFDGPNGTWAGWFPSLYVYQEVNSVLGGARELRSYRSGKITIDASAGTLEWGGMTVSPEYGIRYGSSIGDNVHPTKGPNPNAGRGTPLNLELSLDAELVLRMGRVSQTHPNVEIWLYSGSVHNWYPAFVTLSPGEVRVPLSAFGGMSAGAAEDIDGIRVAGFAHLDAGTAGTGTVFQQIAIAAGNADADGDGINDEDDAFPFSDLSATVTVSGCDSGVGNQVLSSGATFMDLIGAAAGAGGNHGEFVSAVTGLANGWKTDGLISGRDQGRIVSCAARTNGGKGGR